MAQHGQHAWWERAANPPCCAHGGAEGGGWRVEVGGLGWKGRHVHATHRTVTAPQSHSWIVSSSAKGCWHCAQTLGSYWIAFIGLVDRRDDRRLADLDMSAGYGLASSGASLLRSVCRRIGALKPRKRCVAPTSKAETEMAGEEA